MFLFNEICDTEGEPYGATILWQALGAAKAEGKEQGEVQN